jgi:hypothetical protein
MSDFPSTWPRNIEGVVAIVDCAGGRTLGSRGGSAELDLVLDRADPTSARARRGLRTIEQRSCATDPILALRAPAAGQAFFPAGTGHRGSRAAWDRDERWRGTGPTSPSAPTGS